MEGKKNSLIPEGTSFVGEYAFFDNKQIEEVLIPDSVRRIGKGAFSGCAALKKITFGSGLVKVGPGAFFGCANLEEIILPPSVKSIGDHAFASCASLKRVVLSRDLESLGVGVFPGCVSLLEITSGDSEGAPRSIPGGVSLTDMLSRRDNTDTLSKYGRYICRDGVLFEKTEDGLLLLVFPQGRGGQYVTDPDVVQIAPDAFRGCCFLEKVTLQEPVEYIGDRAFSGCADIKVTIKNKHIETGKLPFEETANVQLSTSGKKNKYAAFGEVNFEEKLANIRYIFPVNKKFVVPNETWSSSSDGEGAVITSYNGDGTELTTPSKINNKPVTAVGDYAFSPEKGGIDKKGRDTLARIRSVFLARGITSIGQGAFKNCASLEYVLVPGNVTYIGDRAFSGCARLESVTLPQELTEIGKGIFFGCKSLGTIDIPGKVRAIEELAFSGCDSLTFISVPEGVTRIGRKAFSGCGTLMYVTVPDSVVSIGADAFKNTPWYLGRPKGLIYAGKCLIGYTGDSRKVSVNEGIVSISDGTFAGNERLTDVSLPEGLCVIGSEAFWNCTQLRSINIPKTVTEIGERAFAGCQMIGSADIPEGIKVIREFAFSDCAGIKEVTLPKSVLRIERSAFRKCSFLNSFRANEGLLRIDDEAFQGCLSLKEIYLPGSVEIINERAFVGSPNVVIRAPKGSAAEEFARKARVRFQAV